jgi:hypothetical protein
MEQEKDILEKGIERLRKLLDEHGLASRMNLRISEGGHNFAWDAVIELPDTGQKLGVAAKSILHPGQIDKLLFDVGFDEATRRKWSGGPVPLALTSRVSESAFDHCVKNGLNVLDLEGNVFLKLKGLCLERYRPAARNEKPRIANTPFTAKGSRIVRALLANPGKFWRQKELADKTEMSTGYVSQIVRRLAADEFISPALLGEVRLNDPDRLLEEWASRCRFDRHRKRQYAANFATYEEGLRKVAGELKRGGVAFAFTGWSGAFLRAPYGIPPTIMAYVDRVPEPKDVSTLFPVEQEGNVLLYLPHDDGVLQFTQDVNDLPVVADVQLYVDLRNMPGRAKEQAEVLREKHLQRKAT